MAAEHRPIHSPLGASSAERWMSCPGSVALIKELTLPETDEPEYRGLGTAAHEAGAKCLKEGLDAWELVGQKFHDFVVDVEMADAIQVYLDKVRPAMALPDAKVYVEYSISRPEHEKFYGTVDCGVVYQGYMEVTDYKHGQGIVVEVENNPQLLYYAFGFLREHPDVQDVLLRIVQPRTFSEPVKEWTVKADFIRKWAEEKLLPAMHLTEMDGAELDAGSWCRFCPAKLVCPLMTALFGAACTANPKSVVELTNASLGRSYQYKQAVTFYMKALDEEIFRRLNTGTKVPRCKLVPKKANRVFKDGASEVFKEKFGDDAMSKPELKSPAEMAKIGPAAAELVKEYAYTPQTGLTVATDDDNRVEVKVQTTEQAFGGAIRTMRDKI